MNHARPWIAAAFVSGLALGGLFVDRILVRAEAQDSGVQHQIKAHEIVLVDQDGKVRMALKAEKNSTSGVMLYDADGRTLTGLMVDKEGKVATTPLVRAARFEVPDEYGRVQSTWSWAKRVQLEMHDETQKVTTKLTSTDGFSIAKGADGAAEWQVTSVTADGFSTNKAASSGQQRWTGRLDTGAVTFESLNQGKLDHKGVYGLGSADTEDLRVKTLGFHNSGIKLAAESGLLFQTNDNRDKRVVETRKP